MKVSLLKLGVVTALATGLFYGEAAAETGNSFDSASSEITQNQNPTFREINEMLTTAAIDAKIPPEVVKAIAMEESGWNQYKDGAPLVSDDNGIGIMQVTDYDSSEEERLKTDIEYNIKRGIEILNDKYKLIASREVPGIKGADRYVIENWYFPVMAYNGIKPVNSPLKQEDGSVNTNAYQEKVFAKIENDSFLGGTQLAEFNFSTEDFQYNPASDKNIKFVKNEYTVNHTHNSAYFIKTGDWVTVTGKSVNVRKEPNSSLNEGKFQVSEHTGLQITGDFKYEEGAAPNQFVWYPVKTEGGKTGYISSAYLKDGYLTPMPSVIEFIDVEDKYKEAVAFLFSKGIKGITPTTFGTQKNITRVDAAVFVARALELDLNTAPNSGFKDVPKRAMKEVNALKEAGITNGKTKSTFASDQEITRGELAIWLQKAYQLDAGNQKLSFKDVSDRYQNAVSALVHHEITNGISETAFGTEQSAKRGDFALFLYRAHLAIEE